MPSARPALRSASLLRLAVWSGWLLFTLLVIAISWTGSILRGRPSDIGGLLLWNVGWLLWAAGTFLVIRLTRQFPLERKSLGRGLVIHTALGISVSVGLLMIEFLLNHGIGIVWPEAPRANAFLGYIVYKFHVYFLIYWMLLGATRAFDFHTKFRESELLTSQLETQLAQAQLVALKTQLHPHFLFNTHHAIISLMLKQDNARAIAMLTRLSDLLRITLRKTNDQLSALRDELEALDLYLGIQRERYGERLTVRIDVEPAALSAEVPWLLLQPLVENALEHGIDALPCSGVLCIRARSIGNRLEISVSDNGPGLALDFDLERSTGIGLQNTRARLARLYGDDQKFEIMNTPPRGAEVRVALPLRAFAPSSDTASVVPAHA